MLVDGRVEAMIPVLDLDVARQFYGDKLGLREIEFIPPRVEVTYECGEGSHIVIYELVTMVPAVHSVAQFIVPDVREAVRELQARGVVFEQYDLPSLRTIEGVAHVRGHDFAWFKDPDRNVLGIHN